jgi:hypothetical protein
MDFRITAYMKYGFLITIVLLIITCKVRDQRIDSPNLSSKLSVSQEQLRQLFKGNYLKECLYLGFNPEDRKYLTRDVSFESDFALGKTGYKALDSLVLIQLDIIKQDSIEYFDEIKLKDKSYSGKKRILQVCLDGYESQKVDSIAIALALKLTRSK